MSEMTLDTFPHEGGKTTRPRRASDECMWCRCKIPEGWGSCDECRARREVENQSMNEAYYALEAMKTPLYDNVMEVLTDVCPMHRPTELNDAAVAVVKHCSRVAVHRVLVGAGLKLEHGEEFKVNSRVAKLLGGLD